MALIKKFRIKSFKKQKPIVALKKISLSFGQRQILDDVSFNINQGEILGMLGPNGVGKSTIFNLITGLIKPDYGSIFFDNIDATNFPIYLRSVKFKIGYVPQHGGFFLDLTTFQNLVAVGEILISDKKDRDTKINQIISKFELDAVRDVKAKFLSGGQKKKIVIAMALLGDPKILLLDEPFAALDILTIKMLQEIIVNLQTENQSMATILCDHQAKDLLSCTDSALVLSNCKIVAHGSPSEIVNNVNAKSAYFGDSFKIN
jgi:lipopolysaccharide export system ATP-binding protein